MHFFSFIFQCVDAIATNSMLQDLNNDFGAGCFLIFETTR